MERKRESTKHANRKIELYNCKFVGHSFCEHKMHFTASVWKINRSEKIALITAIANASNGKWCKSLICCNYTVYCVPFWYDGEASLGSHSNWTFQHEIKPYEIDSELAGNFIARQRVKHITIFWIVSKMQSFCDYEFIE